MADIWTAEKRSDVMSRIRSKDTKPELLVRSLLHRKGYRFRVHRKDLPGKPDIIFPRYRTVVFIHGCFWHKHADCIDGKMPKSRLDYWGPKLKKNVERDKNNQKSLWQAGWNVLVIWECEVNKAPDIVLRTITQSLALNEAKN